MPVTIESVIVIFYFPCISLYKFIKEMFLVSVAVSKLKRPHVFGQYRRPIRVTVFSQLVIYGSKDFTG